MQGIEKMSSVMLDASNFHRLQNMDQTPLPFSFTSEDTYANTGDKTVWIELRAWRSVNAQSN